MEKQIEIWLKRGVITADQAAVMTQDLKNSKKLNAQNRFVIVVSIIGAALLGIGAILFIAANWEYMTPTSKVLILSLSTVGIYLLGYYFRYEKRNLPNVGSSLLFLSALLLGASIFLVAQIYNYNANAHYIILIWLLLLLPFLYTIRTYMVSTLVTIIFYVWLFVFLQNGFLYDTVKYEEGLKILSLYLFSAVSLVSFGTLHQIVPSLHKVGRAMKWISIEVAMIALFYFSFDQTDNFKRVYYYDYNVNPEALAFLQTIYLIFAIMAVGLACLAWLAIKNHKTRMYEFSAIILTVFLTMLFISHLEMATIFAIIYNFLIFGICLALIYTGYQREDIKTVNLGVFWVCILVAVRYFDYFWELMDRSIFFLIGGTVLIVGAIFLERGRRNLKEKFSLNHTQNNG